MVASQGPASSWLGRSAAPFSKPALAAGASPSTPIPGSGGSKALVSVPRPTLMRRMINTVKHELMYYKTGFQLLGREIAISFRLGLKLLHGHTLTRRERRQFQRTTIDVLRMVPFSIFVLVPMLEFALPIVLKMFPALLPSTFHSNDREAELRRHLKAHLEITKFFHGIGTEMARRVETRGGESAVMAHQFRMFIEKVKLGEPITTSEIARFAPLFEDELTLDRLSRAHLVLMCKSIGRNHRGPAPLLRYQLSSHISYLQEDDCLIAQEGLDSLTHSELITAFKDRGIRASPQSSTDTLRAAMGRWLDLSVGRSIPPVLLLMSRALMHQTGIRMLPSAAMAATIEAIPEETLDSIPSRMEAEAEGMATIEGLRAQLELVEAENEAIKREQEQQEQLKNLAQTKPAPPAGAGTTAPVPTTASDDLVMRGVLTSKNMQAMIDAIRAISADRPMSAEIEEIQSLKRKLADLQAESEDGEDPDGDANRPLKRLQRETDKKVAAMIQQLEAKVVSAGTQLGEQTQCIDHDHDGKFDLSELLKTVDLLNDEFRMSPEAVRDLMAALDTDHDGRVSLKELHDVLIDAIRHNTRSDSVEGAQMVMLMAEHLGQSVQADGRASGAQDPDAGERESALDISECETDLAPEKQSGATAQSDRTEHARTGAL